MNIIEMEELMQKEQVLFTAVKKNLSMKQIGENSATAFKVIHECVDMINITGMTEEAKKKKLISCLKSFWRGKSKFVSGCKREQIQKIAELAFGITDANRQTLSKEINNFTFEELYLYYYYIEQIARGDEDLYKIILKNYIDKQRNNEEKHKEKQKEKQKKKEKLEKEEQEKLEKMDKEERWSYEIFQMKQDMNYFQRLVNNGFDDKDRVQVARLLKKYWKENKMWEGNKVNKKQTGRIDKINEILGIKSKEEKNSTLV